jgi:hypothetical protein
MNWIACSKQLPQHNNKVVVCDELGQWDIGRYDGKWHTESPMAHMNKILYWIELPKIPYL